MGVIFLDNAATTPLEPRVKEEMIRMMDNFGNPSSTHLSGRGAKVEVEVVRKRIAQSIGAEPGEIFFTSGGTEADNMALFCSVRDLGVERIITTHIEHHAVGHPVEFMVERGEVSAAYLSVDAHGDIDLEELESLLENGPKTLVSLMFANNEIGNLNPVAEISTMCKNYGALFHSDTVQAVGHYTINLQKTPIDFMVASAHKFHGPKGVGFAYFKKGFGIQPMFHGGDQEKGARSSTENVHGILGMEKAFVLASNTLEKDKLTMNSLKQYFIDQLLAINSSISFNGQSASNKNSSCTILNVSLPVKNELLLFNLDLYGIAVSGGSACQSGSNTGSHVLSEITNPEKEGYTSVRFSFSRYTSIEDINYAIQQLKKLL